MKAAEKKATKDEKDGEGKKNKGKKSDEADQSNCSDREEKDADGDKPADDTNQQTEEFPALAESEEKAEGERLYAENQVKRSEAEATDTPLCWRSVAKVEDVAEEPEIHQKHGKPVSNGLGKPERNERRRTSIHKHPLPEKKSAKDRKKEKKIDAKKLASARRQEEQVMAPKSSEVKIGAMKEPSVFKPKPKPSEEDVTRSCEERKFDDRFAPTNKTNPTKSGYKNSEWEANRKSDPCLKQIELSPPKKDQHLKASFSKTSEFPDIRRTQDPAKPPRRAPPPAPTPTTAPTTDATWRPAPKPTCYQRNFSNSVLTPPKPLTTKPAGTNGNGKLARGFSNPTLWRPESVRPLVTQPSTSVYHLPAQPSPPPSSPGPYPHFMQYNYGPRPQFAENYQPPMQPAAQYAGNRGNWSQGYGYEQRMQYPLQIPYYGNDIPQMGAGYPNYSPGPSAVPTVPPAPPPHMYQRSPTPELEPRQPSPTPYLAATPTPPEDQTLEPSLMISAKRAAEMLHTDLTGASLESLFENPNDEKFTDEEMLAHLFDSEVLSTNTAKLQRKAEKANARIKAQSGGTSYKEKFVMDEAEALLEIKTVRDVARVGDGRTKVCLGDLVMFWL